MQTGQRLDLFAGQAFDPRIMRMGVQRDLGLRQWLAQRFRINGKPVTTLDERKTGHERDSFLSNSDTAHGEIEGKLPGVLSLREKSSVWLG